MPNIFLTGNLGIFDNIVGNQLFDGGGLTYGNFQFSSRIGDRIPRNFYTNSFGDPINLEKLGVNNIDGFREFISKELNVYPNYDITQVINFSLYGSLSKRFSVAITNIINKFPASIDVNYYDNDLNTGYTATNIIYDEEDDTTEFDINIERIKNPFLVDFSTNAQSNLLASEGLVSKYRDITKYYSDYILYIGDKSYEVNLLTPSSSLFTGTLKVEVNGKPFESSTSITSYIIRPNDFVFNYILKTELDEIEQYMLTTLTEPKYTMVLQVPQEDNNGQFIIVDSTLTFPLDGIWNLDISSSNFTAYLEDLQEKAGYFDEVRTNLISRFLVSDSIKEFDTFDRRVESVLQIYGRSFDEVKKFIDSLAYMNSINYTPKNDIPSQLVYNLARTLGWVDNFQIITDDDLINSIFGNQSDFKYPAYNRSQTPLELSYSFYRNLVINSFYLFKSKGTRRSIEFILNLFGIPEPLIEFNEHIYLADQKINLTKFNTELIKIRTGSFIDNDPILTNDTYTFGLVTYSAFTANTSVTRVNFNVSNYPVDVNTGYPKTVEADDFFFQMGAGWYQLTPSHRSLEVQTRIGSGATAQYGTKFEDFTYGEKYLEKFRKFPFIDEGFSIYKYIDNKKSWDSNNVLLRNSSDGNYNAYYNLKDERLLLNVKNVDLFINPSQGLLYDVWVQSREYDYPIPESGLTYPYPTTGGTDSTFIDPKPASKTFFEFSETFSSSMINVRNRMYITDGKTGGYPTLQSIFWKYIQAKEKANIDTNKYTYQNLIDYSIGVNPNWIKLVEQMIPATTLWMAGVKYENSPFHRQKYAYKRRLGCAVGLNPKDMQPGSFSILTLEPIGDADIYITTPIFKDVLVENGTKLLAVPNQSFNDILSGAILSAKENADNGCLGVNVLTSWFTEIILDNKIVSKVKFYDGIGNTDVPNMELWNNNLTTALSDMKYYNINYETPNIDNTITLKDFTLDNSFSINKLLTLNVGVDVTLICE